MNTTIFILFLFTPVAGDRIGYHQDWRQVAQFQTKEACEHARFELGRVKQSRCIPNK